MIKARFKRIILTAIIGSFAVLFSACSNEEAYRLVKVQSYDGAVTVQREEKLNAFEGLQLITNDTVSVGDKSFLELLADSDKHIAAEENTGFVLHSTGDENSGDITIDLLYGKSLFTIDNKLSEGSTFEVNTPNATLSVRGTSFSAAYDEETKTTNVEVYSGTVQLNSGDEELLIEKDGIATIITTDEGVKIITNSTAGNPNAIAIPENTEKLFAIAMTYPQKDNYSALNAEYKAKASDYTAKETGISDDDIVFQKFIGLIKNHNEEISKFFEENKANAVANTNKLLDVTDWFKKKIAVGDNDFRIDKAIMDMSIYGSNINKKYITSDTYKVNTEGVDMYFCANGVEISFYGGFEKAAVVTTTTTTTTVPETTVPETTTVETTTTTVTTTAVTTTAPVTTTTTTTTAKKETQAVANKHKRHKKDTSYDANGEIITYTLYKYSSDGLKCEEKEYDKNGQVERLYTYYYNPDGTVKERECIVYNSSNKDFKKFEKYNSQGRIYDSTTVYYDESGSISRKIVSTSEFDSHNNITYSKIIDYDASGKITNKNESKYVNKYDSHDNLVKESKYSEFGTLINTIKYEYKYDLEGRKVERKTNASHLSYIIIDKFEYGKNGKLIRQSRFKEDNEITPSFEFIFDSDGDRIKNIIFNDRGELSSYTIYEYYDD